MLLNIKDIIFKTKVYNEEAQLPTVYKNQIFYSKKINGKSHIFKSKISKSLKISNEKCILQPGERGCFDDKGVMPSCKIEKKLFYTGWNTDKGDVPYGHGIGIINGNKRISKGPIIDRQLHIPYLANSPFVIKINDKYHMWFCNGTGWSDSLPLYGIGHAISKDLVKWNISKKIFGEENKAYSRPYVAVINNKLYMWCAVKTKVKNYKIIEFCNNKVSNNWKVQGELDLPLESWNDQMLCYPWLTFTKNNIYLFVNGNNYGQTGIGCYVYKK